MSPRTKAISIIAGALILFGLLVATVFDLFPAQEEAGVLEETQVVLPDRDEGIPSGAVFEAGNADEFAAVNPSAGGAPSQGTLEREAEDLAVFFLERFGTYSSDAGFSYLDDLAGFETPSMQRDMEAYQAAAPAREGFYSITADLASIATDAFSPATRFARFNAVVNRSENTSGVIQQYQQEAVVTLSQSSSGEWLVSGVAWGDKR